MQFQTRCDRRSIRHFSGALSKHLGRLVTDGVNKCDCHERQIMTVFYLQFEAAPHPLSEHFAQCGGAYVNCWVNASTVPQAQKLATNAIVENGWLIVGVEERGYEVTEQWYLDDDETLEYFEQANTDGECYVFHQWPVELRDQVN
jgi:hypothetical protein